MYTEVELRTQQKPWQVTVAEVAAGTSFRSRVDVRDEHEGFALFMRDVHGTQNRASMLEPDALSTPSERSVAPWSMLGALNSDYFHDGKGPASGCFILCTQGGLVRAAFADSPGGFVEENGKAIRKLQGGGAPLGLFPDSDFPESICLLDRDEAVVFINGGLEALIAGGLVRISDLFARRIDPRVGQLTTPRTHPATAVIIRRIAGSLFVPGLGSRERCREEQFAERLRVGECFANL
jgi:hypothetical protein